jgi:hypothetical protein
MASSYLDLVGPPPLATTFAFRRWYFDLLAARLAEAPVQRATTYHFDSVNGDDVSGDGSVSSPWQTLVKAQTALDAWTPDAGGLALLFRRGQVFKGLTGLNVTKDRVTVAGYGDGSRPLFSRFTQEYGVGGGGWTQVSASHYKRGPMVAVVGWIRRQDDRLNPPQCMTDAAGVTATDNSWWYDAANLELHVNFGVDPDALNLELVFANSEDGIRVTGDGCRLDGLCCDGWGVNPDNPNIQRYGIKTGGLDAAAVVVSNCDAHFNSRHNIGHYTATTSSVGGMATFINCRAGWTLAASGGETAFVGYTYKGGTELIFHDCRVAHSHLPEIGRTYPRNEALKTHTGVEQPPHALIVCWGFRVEAGDSGYVRGAVLDGTPPAATLAQVRTFNVEETIEAADGRGNGHRPTPSHVASINCDWSLRPNNSPLSLINPAERPQDGWLINSRLAIDLRINNPSNIDWGLHRGAASTADVRIWHSLFDIIGDGVTNVGLHYQTLRHDATYNGFPGGELRNSIVRARSIGPDSFLCFNGDSNLMTANAVSTDTWADGTDRRRYSVDGQLVVIAAEWPLGQRPVADSPLHGRGASIVRVEYDASWQPRDPAAPTIGPFEPAYASTELAALHGRLDTAIHELSTQLPTATATALLASPVDGVAYASALEAVMAVLFGVATRSGDTVTFHKQDGMTAKVSVALGAEPGERPASALV